jgi:Carbohydrate-binding family 9
VAEIFEIWFCKFRSNKTRIMKSLKVKRMEPGSEYPSLPEIAQWLEKNAERHRISELNWDSHLYLPEVEFSIAYTAKEILLKYYITEEWFKAEKKATNEMVCEDSCVEFFVSPAIDGLYYNIEFNGIGTCLVGVGHGRADSTRIDPELIGTIRRSSSAGTEPVKEKKGPFTWELTAAVPFELFFLHRISDPAGKKFRANFYKCGDMLTMPHYVTWNRIAAEKPDYHRPDYFGVIEFE